jgi:hypothetical protein
MHRKLQRSVMLTRRSRITRPKESLSEGREDIGE